MVVAGPGWHLIRVNHSNGPTWAEAVSGTHILVGVGATPPVVLTVVGCESLGSIGSTLRIEGGSVPNTPSVQGFYQVSLTGNTHTVEQYLGLLHLWMNWGNHVGMD